MHLVLLAYKNTIPVTTSRHLAPQGVVGSASKWPDALVVFAPVLDPDAFWNAALDPWRPRWLQNSPSWCDPSSAPALLCWLFQMVVARREILAIHQNSGDSLFSLIENDGRMDGWWEGVCIDKKSARDSFIHSFNGNAKHHGRWSSAKRPYLTRLRTARSESAFHSDSSSLLSKDVVQANNDQRERRTKYINEEQKGSSKWTWMDNKENEERWTS